MPPAQLAKYLDLANHHADSTPDQIKLLCQKVREFGFNSAFVNPFYVPLARSLMAQDGKVGTVISFPLGQDVLEIKLSAARRAISDGADELDVSLNVGRFKSAHFEESLQEMEQIVKEVKTIDSSRIVKFIIETGFLTPGEIVTASELVLKSGADFIKADSGLGPRGTSVEDIEIIKKTVGDKIKIKAAGGIETYDQAIALIQAGADRLGTSHAVEIITQPSSTATQTPKISE